MMGSIRPPWRIGRADPGLVDAVSRRCRGDPDRISRGSFGYMMIGRSFTGYDPRRGRLRAADD